MRVLIVDDESLARVRLATLLEEIDAAGIQIVGEAADGVSALDLIRQHQPDVVLLDMHMPRLNGKDTLDAIRDRWQNLLVFGVSGSTPAENGITLGGPRGVDEWFEKPLNPSQLVKRLRQRLGSVATAPA